jgi:hypothetical protein
MISYRTALCFVVALGLTSVAAMGQTTPLPSAFRQQPSFSPDEVKTIGTWVAGQLQRLGGTDVQQQTQARETLVAGANGSPAFQDAYAQALDGALAGVIKGKDFRARLNAAVVAARVAEKVNNPRLQGVALLMIGDQNDGIVLWGIKTAKSVIPAIYNAQGAAANPGLIKAVTQVALAKGSGPIVAEAYEALAPRVQGMTNVQPLVKATFPAIMQLMSTRNKAYVTAVPDEPTAELGALLFVSLSNVWATLSPAEQVQAMQQISDLIGLAGQRWTTSRTIQDHLSPLISQAGKAVQVIADQPGVKSTELRAAGAALARVNPSVSASDVTKFAAAVYPILKNIPAFQSLTPPPTVNPVAAPVTTSPAPAAAAPATAAKTTP